MIMRDYVRICKPAFFSTGITDDNLLFDLLLGKEISTERAEEYGERFWRLAGERHTLICIDTGDCLILERVEECHHDDSVLDELFAAASILSAGLRRKQEFFERVGEERVREFIAKHSGYFAKIFESDEDVDEDVAMVIINSPAPVLCQLLHVLLDLLEGKGEEKEKEVEGEGEEAERVHEVVARVVSALGEERLLAVLGNDFRLRRRLLPLLV